MPFLVSLHIKKEEFDTAVDEEIVQEVDEMVAESADLGAAGSEVVEAILTPLVQSESNHTERVRKVIVRKRKGTLYQLKTP